MLLDGRKLANDRLLKLADKISAAAKKPAIHFVRIGNDPASEIYVNIKAAKARSVGIKSTTTVLASETTQDEAAQLISQLNHDKSVDAILIQLPLPKHIDTDTLINMIDPQKDVDGLTDINVGRLSRGQALYTPCTPKGILSLLSHYDIPLDGQNVIIIGRSRIVGKPLSYCFTNHNATVTLCHQKTVQLKEKVQSADVIVSATGRRDIINPKWIKDTSIVIDVGIHRTPQGICGDIDLSEEAHRLKAYTPVPGGVGPMTVCSLLENTFLAAQS